MSGKLKATVGICMLLGAMALGYVGYAQWVVPDRNAEDLREDNGIVQRTETGPLYEMPELVTDLKPSAEGYSHFVSIAVAFECESASTIPVIEDDLPLIKDAMLEILRSKTPEELKGNEGMRNLRLLVLTRVNEILAPDKIADVYFTSMMVQ